MNNSVSQPVNSTKRKAPDTSPHSAYREPPSKMPRPTSQSRGEGLVEPQLPEGFLPPNFVTDVSLSSFDQTTTDALLDITDPLEPIDLLSTQDLDSIFPSPEVVVANTESSHDPITSEPVAEAKNVEWADARSMDVDIAGAPEVGGQDLARSRKPPSLQLSLDLVLAMTPEVSPTTTNMERKKVGLSIVTKPAPGSTPGLGSSTSDTSSSPLSSIASVATTDASNLSPRKLSTGDDCLESSSHPLQGNRGVHNEIRREDSLSTGMLSVP